MNKIFKQVLILIVMLCMFSSNLICPETAFAKTHNVKTVKSSKKNIQIKVGKTATIKLKNPKGKVKWKIANKKVVRIVNKSGKYKNKIVIKGRKAGKTKITVKKMEERKESLQSKIIDSLAISITKTPSCAFGMSSFEVLVNLVQSRVKKTKEHH